MKSSFVLFQMHTLELKYRFYSLLFSFFLSLLLIFHCSYDFLFLFISYIHPIVQGDTFHLIYTSPMEAFISSLSLGLSLGFYFVIPNLLIHIYLFFLQGLHLNEKKEIRKLLLFTYFCYLSTILLTILYIIPLIISFSSQYENINGTYIISMMGKLEDYQSFFIRILYLALFINLFPVILVILLKLNWVSIHFLMKYRRWFYFVTLIIGALITPPDLIYQIMVALFLIFIYEIFIFLHLFFHPNEPYQLTNSLS